MAITLWKNPKESVDRLISRFNKKVQSSRIILMNKERRYRKKEAKYSSSKNGSDDENSLPPTA